MTAKDQSVETQLLEATQVNAALGKANEGLTKQLTDLRRCHERQRTALLTAEKMFAEEH